MPPIKGAWLAQQQGYEPYSQNLKWGTGINPVHGFYGGQGRNSAPGNIDTAVQDELVDPDMADQYGYTDEDVSSQLYGFNYETGTANYPHWGSNEDRSQVQNDWPQYGPYQQGIPGGTRIRSIERGAQITISEKQTPSQPWGEGWVNKETGTETLPTVSDPSQYEMQTSMTQLHKVREGSQRSGTQSDYDAPIASRVPGMKIKPWPGGQRHSDMEPKEQNPILRPFWNRTAGTGNPSNMLVNEVYQSEPFTREPPPSAYAGPTAGTDEGGFVEEDPVY